MWNYSEKDFHKEFIHGIRVAKDTNTLPKNFLIMGRSEGNFKNRYEDNFTNGLIPLSIIMGYNLGDADISICAKSKDGKYSGLDIELKYGNGKLSEAQIEKLKYKQKYAGHLCCILVCKSFFEKESALKEGHIILKEYLKGKTKKCKKYTIDEYLKEC